MTKKEKIAVHEEHDQGNILVCPVRTKKCEKDNRDMRVSSNFISDNPVQLTNTI